MVTVFSLIGSRNLIFFFSETRNYSYSCCNNAKKIFWCRSLFLRTSHLLLFSTVPKSEMINLHMWQHWSTKHLGPQQHRIFRKPRKLSSKRKNAEENIWKIMFWKFSSRDFPPVFPIFFFTFLLFHSEYFFEPSFFFFFFFYFPRPFGVSFEKGVGTEQQGNNQLVDKKKNSSRKNATGEQQMVDKRKCFPDEATGELLRRTRCENCSPDVNIRRRSKWSNLL